MSFLTKLFVVSLVVLSLLLSAASITFVNAVDDYKVALEAAQNAAKQAEAKGSEAAAAADAEAAKAAEALKTANANIQSLTDALNAANGKVGEANTALAAAKAQAQTAELNVARLTAATSAGQAITGQLQQQVTALRDENTKLQGQNGDLNVALADTTQKLSVTEEQRRDLAEQLTQAKTNGDRLSSALRDIGQDPNKVVGGLAAGAPPINGVIRTTRLINGIPHAQISVGADDAVKVDMEFSVLDRTTGQFLGTMKIVAVEPNEAIGRLQGPNVTAIAAGAEVRTQL